jgi:hypothetical protein
MCIDPTLSHRVVFGEGKVTSLGTAKLRIPLSEETVEVEFHVVRGGNIPVLLSLTDIDRMKIYLRTLTRELVRKDQRIPLHFDSQYGLLFLRWEPQCLYTQQKLYKLHRQFGYRSADQLRKVLERARPNEWSAETRKALEEIVDGCRECAKWASRPRRFKLSLGAEDLRFNAVVMVDIM